jgi:predicted phosphodiesterase
MLERTDFMSERIALLADVHGNATALAAVLADAKAHQATRYWFLGDLILPGPGASDLFDLLASVHTDVILNGNWEDSFFSILGGAGVVDNTFDIYFMKICSYIEQRLTPTLIQAMRQHPIATVQHVGPLTIGLSHNLPHKSYGRDLYPEQPQANYDNLFADQHLDIAVFGHIHQQLMRYSSQGQLIINPGAVGQAYDPWTPLSKDHRAEYALLDVADNGVNQVDLRRIPYDVEQELATAKAANLPYYALYEQLRRTGQTYNHDEAALKQANDQFGYRQDAIAFRRSHHLLPY